MSKNENAPSVREQIKRNRNTAIGFAALNAVAAAGAYMAVALNLTWPLLIWAGVMSASLVLNGYSAVRAQLALNIYKRNPAAAYLAEIRHAFRNGSA